MSVGIAMLGVDVGELDGASDGVTVGIYDGMPDGIEVG